MADGSGEPEPDKAADAQADDQAAVPIIDVKSSLSYRAYVTMIKMLRKRGYDVSGYLEDIDYDTFVELQADNNTSMSVDKDGEPLYVFFLPETRLNKNMKKSEFEKSIKSIYKTVPQRTHIIVVVTAIAENLKKTYKKSDLYSHIEIFNYDELQHDITDHVYQPKFELLRNGKPDEIMKRMGYKKDVLSSMLVGDPVARFYNARRGDVFKITRTDMRGGVTVAYRVVV